jgi:predicted XRE-type DNA-binding protein
VTLPADIAELLWSYDADRVDPKANVETVVMAVLRLGTWDQIRWLFSHYGLAAVQQVIEKDYFGARTLPVSIRAFWSNVFWPDSPPPELTDHRERWRPTRQQAMQDSARAEVARRLREAVAASGMSQQSFATLLGTSQPRLSSYLTGKVAPSATLLVRAEQLGRSLKRPSAAPHRHYVRS